MENSLISVIIPIYNGEKFLHECIESILKQTYQEWELLLLDDGSIDHTYDICVKYLQKDSRVRVYSFTNCGVGATRNRGMKLAKGEYITFVDADDMVKPDYLEKLLNAIISGKEKNAISICRFYELLDEGKLVKHIENLDFSQMILENQIEELIKRVCLRNVFGSCWRILFPREIIQKNNLRFTDCKIREDQLFFFDIISTCNNIILCDYYLYIYRINDQSVSREKYKYYIIYDQSRYLEFLEEKLNIYIPST